MSNYSGLQQLSKKELIDLVIEMKEKLKDVKEIEEAVLAPADSLPDFALGTMKDDKDRFHLVKIRYDLEKKVAQIAEVTALDTSDPSILFYKSNQFLSESINRKTTGDKYRK